ncbi:MAG TPA: M81 family metallopeptidase [Rubrivivax sp.]|nr:M81 family metallopeptidase [Rubrivivax sp.]
MNSAAQRPSARVAVLGFALESNRFAPVTQAGDFHDVLHVQGAALLRWLREANEDAFCIEMDAQLGPQAWQPVPLLVTAAGPGGPCDADFLARVEQRMHTLLEEAGALDGVYFIGHGAATSTDDDDPDGRLMAGIRRLVGEATPVVALTDFHANLSERFLCHVDLVVGYRTNPHVDVLARSRECAQLLCRLMTGWRPQRRWMRVPMMVPQVAQLTTPGAPMHGLFAALERGLTDGLASASIWPGFSLADVPHAGLLVYAAADDAALAGQAVQVLAAQAWDLRGQLEPRLVSAADALAAARVARGGEPIILADVADNPGGGGRGHTRWLLKALLDAGTPDVLFGLYWSPGLAAQCAQAGVGARLRVRLEEGGEAAGPPIEVEALVLAISDSGQYLSHVGMATGQRVRLGQTVVLRLGGLTLICNALRQQILGSDAFEAFGLDPRAARVIVVKSRGHFRAGFQHLVPAARVFEVDLPGLTSPRLARFDFQRITRPLYPFDRDLTWTPGMHAT